MFSQSDPKVIVALDFDNTSAVLDLLKKIDPDDCRLKIGKELFTSCGPDIVKRVQDLGFEVFLDLKFHDIPVTVAKACKAAANLGVWMLNVHALGGSKMMSAAVKAIEESVHKPIIIAVTLLTSHDQSDVDEIGLTKPIPEQVLSLAKMANRCRLSGVVCSAKEAASIKQQCGDQFIRVTPGIRPQDSNTNDQKRVLTPSEALKAGASYLVIGRPITQAEDPKKVLSTINQSIVQIN